MDHTVVGRVGPDVQLAPGQPVGLTLNAAKLHFFGAGTGAEGGRRLNADQPPAAAAPKSRCIVSERSRTNMDRNSVKWWGPIPAIVTPFDDRGAIDEKLLARNIDILMSKGATGIVIGGCTGEFWALSMEERIALFKMGVKAMAGRGFVIAGSGAVRVEDAITLTRAAHDAGCDGGLVLPPYFVKLSDDEIFAHYEALSKAVDGPVMLYNIPGNAVNALSPALVRRLADLDRIVGVKELSADLEQLLRHRHCRAGPPARVLRAVLGVRRAGGAGRCRRHHRLLPQHVGAGLPRPLLHRTRRQDRGSAPVAGDRRAADDAVHDRRPHALSANGRG